MTVQPSPYDILRAIQDQQAVLQASIRATDRLVLMLAGMLDASAPDPIVQWNAPAPEIEPAPRRVVPSENATPPIEIQVLDFKVRTTDRRAKAVRLLETGEFGLSDLVRKNCAANKKAMSSQIADINQDFKNSGVPLRIEQVGPRNQFRAARYTLRRLADDAVAGSIPSVQSGGEAGERPEKGVAGRGAGDGTVMTSPHAAQSVTSTGAGEGGPAPADPAPAVDARKWQVEPCLNSTPTVLYAPASEGLNVLPYKVLVSESVPRIEKLAAVDGDRVFGPGGMIYVRETAARALDILKHGDMFGLDVVAKRAGCQSAEVARQALNIERANLAAIGLDLYLDKVNVRLRAAS